MSKIVIGGDHAGYALKEHLKTKVLNELTVTDCGSDSAESVDYPDFAHKVAHLVANQADAIGILICGSGNGVAMTANKYADIRAALCWNQELAELARAHNNANILCLPARFISQQEAQNIVLAFLNADFEGGRHERRVQKISC